MNARTLLSVALVAGCSLFSTALFATTTYYVANGPSYRIERTSPCVDAGAKLEWCARRGVAVDIEGQERRRQLPDIGCYEVPRDLGLTVIVR